MQTPFNLSLSITLLATSLFGNVASGQRAMAQAPPEPLVAEASIQRVPVGTYRYVFLSITIAGRQGTLVLDTGAPIGLTLSPAVMTQLGMPVPQANVLDELTIGTTVEHNIPVELGGFHLGAPPGMPPVIGLMGNHMLAHYDVLFDGPARRVRLYKPPTPRGGGFSDSVSRHLAWFPAEMAPADCMPLVHVGGVEDRYPGLDLRANGHAIVGTFDSGSSTTVMNVAAAKLLDIRQSSPHVHRVPDDSAGTYPGAGPQKVWVVTTGVVVTLGTRQLPDGPIYIFQTMNEIYGDRTKPEFSVGTDLLRDRFLFISYSSGQVCLGGQR
jgi:hypothetical protein